uniref:Uncharacterized protein n=1 Tax=Graphocephala atropunctata TaxID=36148 RepID=A0A1B6LKG7_9HEMI
MALGVVLLVAAVFVLHGAQSSVPPKFIKASYGVQKALYARNYGYSLVPIPTHIQVQAHPPKTLPIVGDHPILSARQGRAYKYYKPRSRSRRRRKRPPTKRRRPPTYGLPVYATKYKNYVPSRRPPYSRYKKKRRPYRGPPRRPPPPYREVHHEFDEYEQEIPDDYEEYDSRDSDYYFDVPSKRLPLEYDKEFLNRHADLYNGGYNPGPPRIRPKDVIGQYTDQVRTRVRYQTNTEDHLEQPEKAVEESQESLWPGEVSSVHTHEDPWHDSSNVHTQSSWHEEVHSPSNQWPDHTKSNQQSSHDWSSHPRPPRLDNQWQVYNGPQAQQSYQPQQHRQQHFNWPPRPTRAQELRSWTTSLRPKPLSAAVAVPSRPVIPREQDSRPVYNWDPASNSYQLVEHNDNRPRYQAHYSEADFNYVKRSSSDHVDRKETGSHRSHRAFSEPDIGFGEGLEVVDDNVAGWKVKK